MAKIISDRLLKPGIDPLPIGPTVFSRPVPSEPGGNLQSDMGEVSSVSPDPMQPAIDASEASLQEMARNRSKKPVRR